jgi:hypothetical protein
VNKARAVHDESNPTVGMLERDPALAAEWKPCTEKEIGGGIARGYRFLITDEERERDGWNVEPMVMVYTTKRDGTKKCRATSDGRVLPKDFFDEDYLYAEGLPPVMQRLLTAFGVYFDMVDRSTDVEACFAALNTWDKAKYPRKICHKLTPYQSPTGQVAYMANGTNNYGGRDGPGQWREISRDVLVNKAGFTQSVVVPQVFMRFRGDKGLIVLGQITDDFKLIHTDDADGHAMYKELMEVLQVQCGWVMTESNPTGDFGSIMHAFSEGPEGRHVVTLTQPTQIKKAAELAFGDLGSVPEVFTPLPPSWSAEASASCQEPVSQRDYMGLLMMAAWVTQTRFESPAISLLASRSQRPTRVDMEAARHHVAYLYTSRDCGVTYVAGPQGANIRKTLRLRLFTDAGENQHLDGLGQWGGLVFLGEEADCPGTGAIMGHSQKASGVVGESVPVNELMAVAVYIKPAMLIKYMLDELSGAMREACDPMAMTVPGSAGPTVCGVADVLARAVAATACGAGTGDDVSWEAAQDLREEGQRQRARATDGRGTEVVIYGDNQGVVDNIGHVSHKSKGLRRLAKVIAHLQSMVTAEVICVEKVSSADQRADGLTKQYRSPVQNADAMGRVLGRGRAVHEYQLRVHARCNTRAKGAARLQARRAEQEVTEQEALQMEVEAQYNGLEGLSVFAASAGRGGGGSAELFTGMGWLKSSKPFAVQYMESRGYPGSGGLGARGQGRERPMVRRCDWPGKRGIGNTAGGELIWTCAAAGALGVLGDDTDGEPVFLVERLRRALLKLTEEERWLFSTRLRQGPLEHLLLTDVQIRAEMGGAAPMRRERSITTLNTSHRKRALKRQMADLGAGGGT